jgi:hypothetical protein
VLQPYVDFKVAIKRKWRRSTNKYVLKNKRSEISYASSTHQQHEERRSGVH